MKNQTQDAELLPEKQSHYDPNAKTTALATREAQPLDVTRREPSVADMLQAVVERGITNENLQALEKLTDLYERMEEKKAERGFAAAFNALQAEMPVIVASSVIPNRGKYERFEDVMRQIGPLLNKHGFTVSFTMDFKENRVLETCHLTHVGGHTRTNTFAVRVSGKADSETQADCKAATTAKRNALLNALNIVIRQDCLNEEHDASMEGGNITQAQAEELERRVALTNSNREAFLKVAGATSYATIPEGKYAVLDGMLRRKESGR